MTYNFVQERDHLYQHYYKINTSASSDNNEFILKLFKFQYKYNNIYRQYCKNLGIIGDKIKYIKEIPFLPISAFKNHEIKTGYFDSEVIFTSSGTTGFQSSKHHVRNVKHYLRNTEVIWNHHFSDKKTFCFFALLPGYLEREGSSLISMMNHFIQNSEFKQSGFYLRNHDELYAQLNHCKLNKIPTVLIGVTYALLDFTNDYQLDFPELVIIETGGMKGQRPELIKSELHKLLIPKFGVTKIYSEYGMTELLSQAYTKGENIFYNNPYFQISIKQLNDPISDEYRSKPGIICVTDLANIDSCAFIQTEDMGTKFSDSQFEVSGRINASDQRGCNLLIQEIANVSQ
ncbi:MAG: acyl transferase [Saprospiraceae bacterium]|jgi:hypothetical protein|nr:acyl transferase [Saprospiraceae bacterium]MBL0027435.1 acyl transferase [Saprospiraceae bacterium]